MRSPQCTANANCSSVSQNLAKFLPFNPGPDIALNLDLNNRNREDNGILKLDYHLSEKSNLIATYFIGDSVQTEEDTTVVNPLFLSQSKTGRRSSAEAGSGRPTREADQPIPGGLQPLLAAGGAGRPQ